MARQLNRAERKLRTVATIKEFEGILELLAVSECQKEIARQYYFGKKRLDDIAYSSDLINICEHTVGRELREFSLKLAKYMEDNEFL